MKRISFAVILTSIFAAGAAAQTPTTQRPAPPANPPAQTPTTQRPATPPAGTQQTPPPLPTTQAKPPAAPAPFPADAKIAFVNMQTIVAESKLGKQGQDQMKALHDKNQAALKTKADGITALQQKIQSQQGVVNDSALQAMNRDLERLQREATALQQDQTAAEQNLNDDLLNNFQEKVLPIIDALRTEKGLWVIFAVQGGDGGIAVASANQGLDLSLEIVKRLDAKGDVVK